MEFVNIAHTHVHTHKIGETVGLTVHMYVATYIYGNSQNLALQNLSIKDNLNTCTMCSVYPE